MNAAARWIKDNASTILTFLGAGGTVTAVVMAVKATPKALRKIDDAQARKKEAALHDDASRPDLTVLEKVRACAGCYLPTAAMCTAAMSCIFGANVLNKRQQASLMSAYMALEGAYQKYRHQIHRLVGEETDLVIDRMNEREQRDSDDDRPPWDEVQTFYIEGQRQFFERTMEQVVMACYHFNRNFILKGDVMLNELFDFLDLPHTEEGARIGWNQYDGSAFYGYQWVDFNPRYYTTDDGVRVCALDMPFPPHPFDEAE